MGGLGGGNIGREGKSRGYNVMFMWSVCEMVLCSIHFS